MQPAARIRFSAFPRIFLLILLRLIGSTPYNSGQRLDNVNGIHLVLASCKIVLYKKLISGTATACTTVVKTTINFSCMIIANLRVRSVVSRILNKDFKSKKLAGTMIQTRDLLTNTALTLLLA